MLPLVSIVMPSLNQAAFIPAAVESVLSQSYRQIELMAYGQGEHIDASGAVLGLYPTLAPPVAASQFANGCFICQPTVFFRRTMWLLLGKFDEDLKTAFDFDYWLRAFARFSGRISFVDAVQAQSRLHADCITLRLRRAVALEGMQVLARHLGYAPKEWLLTYVNELLALPPGQRDVGNLKTHVAQTLAVARPWLQAADFQVLEGELGGLALGE